MHTDPPPGSRYSASSSTPIGVVLMTYSPTPLGFGESKYTSRMIQVLLPIVSVKSPYTRNTGCVAVTPPRVWAGRLTVIDCVKVCESVQV